MTLVEFKNFNFGFDEEKSLLKNINLQINEGDFVLINGPSGSGKTTLLTHLKKELMPQGIKTGSITYNGVEIEELDDLTSACDIGYLFQNPDSQIVTDTVIQEIAFPLENIGTPSEEIRNRIAEIVSFFSIKDILHKNVNQLSGGQKQLVNLCSLLVLKPKVLILDEPTSQLDPITSNDFLTILRRLNEEFSITIILTDHRLDNIYPFVDKVGFLSNKEILAYDTPSTIAETIFEEEKFRPYLPEVACIYNILKNKYSEINQLDTFLSVRDARRGLNSISDKLPKFDKDIENITREERILKAKNIYFGYEKNNVFLKDINFEVFEGDFIGLIGGNGAGKSSLLQIIAGFNRPIKGKVKINKNKKISYVHQNPMIHFRCDTVKEELTGASGELLDLFEVESIFENHPFDCSGGEMQKIAIAKALITNPDILILDEPSKGLDPVSTIKLGKTLKKLQQDGLTIIIASHDLYFIAQYCNRCLMLFDGVIQLDSTPKTIFSKNNFYTTFTNRVVKDSIPDGLIIKDVEEKWI